jgi:endoglucanase
MEVAVIKALRAQGFNGYILVEGDGWSGLHTWISGNGTNNSQIFTRDNFKAHGFTDADVDKIVINVHQYLDSDYSGTHDECLTDLSTTGVNGFNLQAFADYLKQNQFKAMVTEFGGGRDTASCSIALNSFLDYLSSNAYDDSSANHSGFLGYTIWSAGHGWGDGYNLRVKPNSYHMSVISKAGHI